MCFLLVIMMKVRNTRSITNGGVIFKLNIDSEKLFMHLTDDQELLDRSEIGTYLREGP